MSIHPILEKIKALVQQIKFEEYLMILIIVLVGLAGFGLGKLSNAGEGKAVIIQTGTTSNIDSIQPTEASNPIQNTANVISTVTGNVTNIVASKNGTKYYLLGCSGAGRIQNQNKVYFNTEQEAIDAGYTKASGCK